MGAFLGQGSDLTCIAINIRDVQCFYESGDVCFLLGLLLVSGSSLL